MTLEVKEFHDCPSIRPSMIVDTVERRRPRFIRPDYVWTQDIYSSEDARWTCPECGSMWDYSGYRDGSLGFWMAVDRKFTWKKVPDIP